jgi:hypothetical protein
VSGAVGEKRFVNRDDLGDVGDGILRQARGARPKENVSWGFCEAEVAGKRNDNHGCDSTSVESVPLNDENRPSKPRTGPDRIGQIRPANIALSDYHSVETSTLRAASDSER